MTLSRRSVALLFVAVLALVPLATLPAQGQTGTLYVEGSSVGIGTPTPQRTLHLFGNTGSTAFRVQETNSTTGGRVMMELQNNGGVNFRMIDTGGHTWQFLGETFTGTPGFSITRQGSGVREFRVDPNGNVYASGTINGSSSKAIKRAFESIDANDLLSRLDQLPIMSWIYNADSSNARHIGPFAEDFHRLFSVGTDDAHISFGDASGVALAAAQELYRQGQAKDARIESLEAELASLRATVEALAATVQAKSNE